MHKSKINLIRYLGYGSLGFITLVTLAMLFPIVHNNINAIDNTTANTETRVAVKATASIAVSVANQVNIDINPKTDGTFGYSSTRLGVATNNEEGYQIFLTTSDGTGLLKNTDSSKVGPNYEISSITGNQAGTSFTGNTWGYTLSKATVSENSTYSAIPTQNTSIYATNTASVGGEDVYNLGFGTHVSTSLAAGEYSNSVILSVVANPVKISNLSQLVYMQDMQPDICKNTAVNVTKQLIDIRDGNRYWVAKLADGHCWMTQNLALDLSVNRPLTPADSDVTENWTPKTSTETSIPLPNTASNLDTRSWNLGKLVLTKPTNGTKCPQATLPNNGQSYPNNDEYNAAFTGQNIAEICSDQVINVAIGWTDGYTATATSSINMSSKAYDSHYLFGNYYQWSTATAGSAIGVTGTAATSASGEGLTNAPNSICPKGWQLPKAGRNTSTTAVSFDVGPGQSYDIDGSFYHLLKAYGYNSAWSVNNGNGLMPINHTSRICLLTIPAELRIQPAAQHTSSVAVASFRAMVRSGTPATAATGGLVQFFLRLLPTPILSTSASPMFARRLTILITTANLSAVSLVRII